MNGPSIVLVTSDGGFKEGGSKNNGGYTEERECIGLNSSSAVGKENTMKVPG